MQKKIDFLVPQLAKDKFGGGIWCVMQYAVGLAKQGHDVRIVPMADSPRPDWVPVQANLQFVTGEETRGKRLRHALLAFVCGSAKAALRLDVKAVAGAFFTFAMAVFLEFRQRLPFEYYRAAPLRYISEHARETDIVVATFYETAVAAALYPAARKLYFCQHLETLFYKEMQRGELSRLDAELSYGLGLETVANSTWLKGQLAQKGVQAQLCCNAINHEFFWPPKTAPERKPSEVVLISYGGRGVDWKGFDEMAAAVALARQENPGVNIRWQVYGDAALPPDNPVAAYEALGFLFPAQLGDAYRAADILLSASWYESFPLFPLEAMACGLATIVTQPGTEDYSRHLDTAYVVEAQNPRSVADGINALVRDPVLRERIARRGNEVSRDFTWEASVKRMTEIVEAS